MLGVNWRKRGAALQRTLKSFFLVGVRFIILLTSAERLSWVCCAHECKSLKHRSEKGMKHHTCFKSQKDFMPEESSIAVFSHTNNVIHHSLHFTLAGDLRNPEEFWGRQLCSGHTKVNDLWRAFCPLEGLGYRAGFLPRTTRNLAFSWNLSRAVLVGLDSTQCSYLAPELDIVLLIRTVVACLLLLLDCMKFSNNAE